MATDDPYEQPSGDKLERRKAWEIRRAQTRRTEKSADNTPVTYEPILFPDYDGLRHAALVIAGAHVDRPNGIAEAREVAWALGIPQIMEFGGDGRKVRVQKTPLDESDPKPLGYSDDDEGRPTRKPRKPRAEM